MKSGMEGTPQELEKKEVVKTMFNRKPEKKEVVINISNISGNLMPISNRFARQRPKQKLHKIRPFQSWVLEMKEMRFSYSEAMEGLDVKDEFLDYPFDFKNKRKICQ